MKLEELEKAIDSAQFTAECIRKANKGAVGALSLHFIDLMGAAHQLENNLRRLRAAVDEDIEAESVILAERDTYQAMSKSCANITKYC